MSRRTATAGAVIATLAATAALAPAALAQTQPDVVADGLANPRGLTFGPGGALYVAEAGKGGKGRCITSPEGAPACYGATGKITRVDVRTGKKRTYVGKLPSLAPATGEDAGTQATGPHDVSFSGGTAYITVGLGGDPAARSKLGAAGKSFAALWRYRDGTLTKVVDLGAYERRNNPDDGQPSAEVDTNPFSVDASNPGRILVTDSGGNDILRVSRRGRVKTVAVLPFGQASSPGGQGLPPAGTVLPVQPVPTGIVRTDAGVLVGQLTGFPFPVGGASVFSYTGALSVKATGFTNVTDVAADGAGNVYALQMTTNGLLAGPPFTGKLVKVAPDGTQTELGAGQLTFPLGLAIRGSSAYVSDTGFSPTDGRIVRIPLG